MKYRLLSHLLKKDSPRPPAIPAPETARYLDIATGGGNVFTVKFTTHSGTHIDAQAHVVDGGTEIACFPIESFVFERPLLLDLNTGDEHLFCPKDFEPWREQILQCDLLLLRTGHQKWRDVEPARYINQNPGFTVACAEYLYVNYPNLRAIALDTPSFSALSALDEGMKAHVSFIGERKNFIIEDADLSGDHKGLRRVFAMPVFAEGWDSSPCTLVAEYGESS